MKKKDLVDKWLNDELTPEEFEVLRTFPEFSSYQKIDQFVKELDTPEDQTEAGLIELKSKIELEKSRRSNFSTRRFLKIAAVVTLLLASYYFLTSRDITTVNTDIAQTETINLPDASEVLLNGDSQLKFRKDGWEKNRFLELEGEAFFKVAKGMEFTVETSNGSVQVLGTEFNVVSRGNTFEVRCFEGKVLVKYNNSKAVLSQGDGVDLAGDKLQPMTVYTSTPSWIRNESTFENTSIQAVVKVLETEYDMDITTENIDVTLRYTGSFPNDNLEAALKAVTLPLNLNYNIDSEGMVTLFSSTD